MNTKEATINTYKMIIIRNARNKDNRNGEEKTSSIEWNTTEKWLYASNKNWEALREIRKKKKKLLVLFFYANSLLNEHQENCV